MLISQSEACYLVNHQLHGSSANKLFNYTDTCFNSKTNTNVSFFANEPVSYFNI
jgi:hypothetical protein